MSAPSGETATTRSSLMSMAIVPPLSTVSIIFGAERDTTHPWVGSTSQTCYLPAMPIKQAGYAELMMYGETDPWPVPVRRKARCGQGLPGMPLRRGLGGEVEEDKSDATLHRVITLAVRSDEATKSHWPCTRRTQVMDRFPWSGTALTLFFAEVKWPWSRIACRVRALHSLLDSELRGRQ